VWIVFEAAVRLLLGGLLVTAGAVKLAATPAWRRVWLGAYRLVPRGLVTPAAWLLSVLEVTTGLVIALGAFSRAGAIAVGILLLVVTGAAVSALFRGLAIPCGCFGRVRELLSWRVVGRNVSLIALALVLSVHGLTGIRAGVLAWPGQLALVGAGLAAIWLAVARGRRRRIALHLAAARASNLLSSER